MDVLLKRILECTAYELAIKDVTDGLDGVLQNGTIPSDVYLKLVRSLARPEFIHRAMAIQAHVTLTAMMGRAMLK